MADLPKWHQFMLPLLEVLKERGELSRNDAIIKSCGMSVYRMSNWPSAEATAKCRSRPDWLGIVLSRTAGIDRPQTRFRLGPNADALFNGRPLKRADLTGFQEWQEHQAAKQAKSQSASDSTSDINTEDSTPEDLIEAGVKQIKEQLVSDLLDQMKEMDPHDFGLVLDVLAAMGYGGGSSRRKEFRAGLMEASTARSTKTSSAWIRSTCKPSAIRRTPSPARRCRPSLEP